jgi:hypothetical protein
MKLIHIQGQLLSFLDTYSGIRQENYTFLKTHYAM